MANVESQTPAGACPFPHGQESPKLTPTGCPVSQRAADFDPFSEYVRWAREQEPVFYNPALGYWVVSPENLSRLSRERRGRARDEFAKSG